jgi:hypothetical protein
MVKNPVKSGFPLQTQVTAERFLPAAGALNYKFCRNSVVSTSYVYSADEELLSIQLRREFIRNSRVELLGTFV